MRLVLPPSESEGEAERRLDAGEVPARDIAAADLDAELAAGARLDAMGDPDPARHGVGVGQIFEHGCGGCRNEHFARDLAFGVAHRPLLRRSAASVCALSASRLLSHNASSSLRSLSIASRLAR